jgi:hypothetical protein
VFRGIDCVSFYDLSVGFWTCNDSVSLSDFHVVVNRHYCVWYLYDVYDYLIFQILPAVDVVTLILW